MCTGGGSEMERGIRIDNGICDGCGTCIAVCPTDALSLSATTLSVDYEICTSCEKCAQVCPLGAIEREADIRHLRSARVSDTTSQPTFAGRYDVVVVGSGPAGAAAAYRAAMDGTTVLLLERDREIGTPVRCAGAASIGAIRPFIPVPESCIILTAVEEEIITSDGGATLLPNGGLAILDRRRFDSHVALLAAEAGANILVGADVFGMERRDAGWRLSFTHNGGNCLVEACLVVAADGVESRVARWAGIETAMSLDDVESSIQYEIVRSESSQINRCQYYVGSIFAPGGYVWVFPKGPGRIHVGAGLLAPRANGIRVREYLDRFVNDRFPGAQIVAEIAGGVPVSKPLKDFVGDRLLVVGDAARMSNPISGAGISAAVVTGSIAGKVAAEACSMGKFDRKTLNRYRSEYIRSAGSRSHALYPAGKIISHGFRSLVRTLQ